MTGPYTGKWVYFDMEYDPSTYVPYWMGLTLDAHMVYGFPASPAYMEAVRPLMSDPTVLKCAHNINADIRSLNTVNVEVAGPIYDTMIGFHVLHPGLEVGLAHAAAFYLDDVRYWKDMAHTDPVYNGTDVAYGSKVMLAQWREASQRRVNVWGELWSRMACVPIVGRMERDGLHVDRVKQNELLTVTTTRMEELKEQVAAQVAPYWEKRVLGARTQVKDQDDEWKALRTRWLGRCRKHKYNGMRAPAKGCEECTTTWMEAADDRARYVRLKSSRIKSHVVAEKWGKGFDATNSHHLQWFLYSGESARLPIKVHGKTRKPTTNKDAIEDLIESQWVMKHRAWVVPILQGVKGVRDLAKDVSTFLDPPLDKESRAHPPYKIHGTVTGRWSSGKDSDEKADNTYAYNAQNIPDEWRCMYVAPPGHILVYCDFSNQEGRLAAYYSGDKAYRQAFKDEDAGGHKVHTLSAVLIYGCDPGDAKRVMVDFKGGRYSAYFAGKTSNHAWTYSYMPVLTLMHNYKMSRDEAERVDRALSEARPGVVEWRRRLVAEVLGDWEPVRRGVEWQAVCTRPGTRFLANAFGWQLSFYGAGKVMGGKGKAKVAVPSQANEVLAFLPQSTGGSILNMCVPLVESRYRVWTCTHDSVVIAVHNTRREVEEAVGFLKGVMEQEWAQLGGLRLPVECKVGENWGEWGEGNPRGLRGVEEVLP